VVKISKVTDATENFVNKVFPNLGRNLKLAQMDTDVSKFFKLVLILSLIFSFNLTVVSFLVVPKEGMVLALIVLFVIYYAIFFTLFINIPKYNISKIRRDIEGDLFIPSRMFLTLLESGNSIVSALEGVSYTKAKSSKYFGKIATNIYLGKRIDQAIDEAIEFTPCDNFRRVLEPIRKSLRTGTDIQKSLYSTLQDLQKEKVIEIERYEKKLGALSLFYMIFGTIIPAISVVVLVLIMSVVGLRINFFPFLFILLVIIVMIQLAFMRSFKNIRPLMRV